MAGRKLALLSLALLACACFVPCARAQEGSAEETVRVRTRVVFLDALVRDRRTSNLVADLKPEDFEVLADGERREISYFSREGDAGRKPLALVLVLDLNRIGAGRFLRRTEILEALASELSLLPAPDEVAVLALDVQGTGVREWLVHFTRERAQVASALSIVPALIASRGADEMPENGAATPTPMPTPTPTPTPTPPGRSVHISINDDNGFEFSPAVHEALSRTLAARPHSQPAIVWLSDGISPVEFKERDEAVASLVRAGAIFSSLTTDMKTGFKLFKPVLKPVGDWAGLSIYGTSQFVARQTGGEAVRVNRPEDYAAGLRKIIGNLTGRYSLGFTLAESERDDGQMHPLEVRVHARDAKGRERRLEVVTRHGYFRKQEEVVSSQ